MAEIGRESGAFVGGWGRRGLVEKRLASEMVVGIASTKVVVLVKGAGRSESREWLMPELRAAVRTDILTRMYNVIVRLGWWDICFKSGLRD